MRGEAEIEQWKEQCTAICISSSHSSDSNLCMQCAASLTTFCSITPGGTTLVVDPKPEEIKSH